MTLKMLNQYRDICREIPDLKQRIQRNRKLLAGHHEVMASMDEYPYIPRTIPLDRVSQGDLQETVRLMQRRLRRIMRQRKEIEEYIDAIGDSQLRQIFLLRFVDGVTWRNLTMEIGGGNAEKALQKKVYSYLKFGGQSREK